jgi:hypothetical protein
MRRLRILVLVLAWLAVVALAGYEITQKAPSTPLGPLPGSDIAARADAAVPYRAATGLAPLDQLLHESREACAYYRGLATGSVEPRRRSPRRAASQ